jgi:hypothetical protein
MDGWMRWVGIALCATTTAMILLAQHYWLRGQKLHVTLKYILGMLAIYVPLTGLFLLWQEPLVVAGMWVVTVFGGAAVIASYLVDGWLDTRARMNAAEREGKMLREALHDAGPNPGEG